MRKMGAVSRRTMWLSFALLLLAGCATMPGGSLDQIGGNRVDWLGQGNGSPVVVLESGMGAPMSTWKPILAKLSAVTRVVAYNRPGYGSSSARSKPKSSGEIARRLREILRETGHRPPYVLVGHSAGGLYINAFARIYPQDVAGVVMIDSSHPAQFVYMKKNHPFMHSVLVATTLVGPRSYELAVLGKAHQEFERLGPFPSVPLLVLTAEKSFTPEVEGMKQQWQLYQQQLSRLSETGKQVVVPDSSHFIHKSQPQAVLDAIVRVVETARSR